MMARDIPGLYEANHAAPPNLDLCENILWLQVLEPKHKPYSASLASV